MCMMTFLFIMAAAWRKQQLLVYALFFTPYSYLSF